MEKVWTAEARATFLRRKERWRRRKIRRWVSYRFGKLALDVLGGLSVGLASDLGAVAGRILAAIPSPLRARARAQMIAALADRRSPRECRRAVTRMFTNLGRCLGEHAVFARAGRDVALRHVVDLSGAENLERARDEGYGVIGVTPHFGHWELLAVAIYARFAGCVVGTRPRFGPADRDLTATRARLGVTTVPHTNAREILRRLRSNEMVGLLPDQDMDRLAGTFLPFFGREAYTVTGPATLAWTAKSPVFPLACIRVGRHTHRVVIGPAIEVPRDRPRDEWIRDMTAAISRALETMISEHPDHWVWFHERWKTTPASLRRRRERRARTEAHRTRKKLAAG